MNHAQWQTEDADRRKKNNLAAANIKDGLNPAKTPDITKQLLKMDEQQLDILTGKREVIFKSVNQLPPSIDNDTTADGATLAENAGAQEILKEGNKGLSLGDPPVQKPSAIHERAR